MDDLVSRLEMIPLSGTDLVAMATKMGNDQIRFYLYKELEGIKTVDELLGPLNSAYILFDIVADDQLLPVGHWAVVMRNKSGVSYYDPYGLALGEDIELSGSAPFLQNILGMHPLDENPFRDQNLRDNLNTCGRHCVVRSVFWFMTNREYHELVITPLRKGFIIRDPDAFVSLMTAFLDPSDRVVIEFFAKRVMP